MGCVLSKKDGEDAVVSLCRERRRLLKLAVEKRYGFADAQFKYNQSLYAVAMAIRLFVARHSSPSSPFLITFPSPADVTIENRTNDPLCLRHTPTEPLLETIPCKSPHFGSSKGTQENAGVEEGTGESEEEEDDDSEGEDDEVVCEHFYDEDMGGPTMPPPSPPPAAERDFAWDFFNPFEHEAVRSEVVNGFSQSSEEELRAVREKEGIPELEEVGDQKAGNESTKVANFTKNRNAGHEEREDSEVGNPGSGNMGSEESKCLRVIDSPDKGRELLEALKDIEDHFIRAYDSGLDVSRMLEAKKVQLHSGLEEIKESSNKLIRSLTWNRSTSFRSPSCRSLLSSSSMNSSMWGDFKAEIFDEYGMVSGSHTLTLGRLYLWEKKLFQEVKIGNSNQKILKRKCSKLRMRKAVGGGLLALDKSEQEITELHTRIMVAIKSAESISNKIQKLRDEELQPQLLELLHGLMRNWNIMLESHETQKRVMFAVKSFNCPAYGKFSNDSHRLATLQLEAEVDNWRSSFAAYVSAQKAYIKALSGWLSKFLVPENEFYHSGSSSALPCDINGPPLLATCYNWLACLEKLPDKAVTSAMKSLGKEIYTIWNQQGEEQQQKRKVDQLSKEVERRALAFQRAERRILESKITENESEVGVRNRIEFLAGRKNEVDMFRTRLEAEKQKHLASMQETEQMTIAGFQTGFSSVFGILCEFSKASEKMYADLVTYSANATTADINKSKASYTGGISDEYLMSM